MCVSVAAVSVSVSVRCNIQIVGIAGHISRSVAAAAAVAVACSTTLSQVFPLSAPLLAACCLLQLQVVNTASTAFFSPGKTGTHTCLAVFSSQLINFPVKLLSNFGFPSYGIFVFMHNYEYVLPFGLCNSSRDRRSAAPFMRGRKPT